MAFERIAVNTDTLKTDVEEMKETLTRIETQYQTMFEGIRSLDGMWEGKTHDMFMTQVGKDYEDMQEMCKTIRELLGCFAYADHEYIHCENQVSSIVSAIRI